MKKVLALLLSLVMALSLLTACGGGNDSNSSSGSNSSGNAGSGTSDAAGPTADNPENVTLKVWGPEEEHDIRNLEERYETSEENAYIRAECHGNPGLRRPVSGRGDVRTYDDGQCARRQRGL